MRWTCEFIEQTGEIKIRIHIWTELSDIAGAYSIERRHTDINPPCWTHSFIYSCTDTNSVHRRRAYSWGIGARKKDDVNFSVFMVWLRRQQHCAGLRVFACARETLAFSFYRTRRICRPSQKCKTLRIIIFVVLFSRTGINHHAHAQGPIALQRNERLKCIVTRRRRRHFISIDIDEFLLVLPIILVFFFCSRAKTGFCGRTTPILHKMCLFWVDDGLMSMRFAGTLRPKNNICFICKRSNHLNFESERNEFTFVGDARFETGHWK